jgi:integrase
MSELLLDRAGRRRSPATMPGFHAGHPPGNRGLRYPADPPKVEEIIAVMRAAGDDAHGRRLRALIVILWRAGLRVQEALALAEADLISAAAPSWSGAARAGAVARSAWTPGAGTSCNRGSRRGSSCPSGRCYASSTARPAAGSGQAPPPAPTCAEPPSGRASARRFAPHQLHHAHAVELAREGVPLIVIQRQLGHSHLGITSIYLQGIDNAEIIETVHGRRQPMIPVSTSPRR